MFPFDDVIMQSETSVGLQKLLTRLEQSKSEGFDSCDRPINITQIEFKSLIFSACVILKFVGNTILHLLYTISSFVHHFKALVNSSLSDSLETPKSVQNWRFFVLCDLEI